MYVTCFQLVYFIVGFDIILYFPYTPFVPVRCISSLYVACLLYNSIAE
jgi:hypothetical protein